MKVSIIKYNAGNIISVHNALSRLGINAIITDDAEEILSSDKVIFPGVGEARTTMQYLKDRKLDILIKSLRQPVLGICLGMQLMCSHSEEGNTPCLGIFDIKVKKFNAETINDQQSTINNFAKRSHEYMNIKSNITNNQRPTIKIPHMGWNNLTNTKGRLFINDQLTTNNDQRSTNNDQLFVYFVHSFYAELGIDTSAVTAYGIEFSSALEKDNFYATQFHPEKSGKTGELILKNFLSI